MRKIVPLVIVLCLAFWVGGASATTAPSGVVEIPLVPSSSAANVAPEIPISAFGAIWVTSHRAPMVFRVDPKTNAVESVPVPQRQCGSSLIASSDRLWFSGCNVYVTYGLDPTTRKFDQQYPGFGVAYAGGSVWITEGGEALSLVRRDPHTGAEQARIPFKMLANDGFLYPGSECLGSLWRTNGIDSVERTDLATNTSQLITLKRGHGSFTNLDVANVACAAGKVWVPNGAGLFQIDPTTNRTRRFPIKTEKYSQFGDVAITSAGNDVYLRTSDTSIAKIDGKTGKVVKRYPATGGGGGLAIANGSLWVVNAINGTLWRESL